jgi:hypothetical protein
VTDVMDSLYRPYARACEFVMVNASHPSQARLQTRNVLIAAGLSPRWHLAKRHVKGCPREKSWGHLGAGPVLMAAGARTFPECADCGSGLAEGSASEDTTS